MLTYWFLTRISETEIWVAGCRKFQFKNVKLLESTGRKQVYLEGNTLMDWMICD